MSLFYLKYSIYNRIIDLWLQPKKHYKAVSITVKKKKKRGAHVK